MTAAGASSHASQPARQTVQISISARTILLVAAAVAIAWAIASAANVLLMIFVSIFSVAVLLPVVNAMERRLGWSRGLCSAVLVLAIVVVLGGVVLVLVQAVSGAIHDLSHDLPQVVEKVRHSQLGNSVNGSNWLDTLQAHTSDITKGVGKLSGGITHVGVSAIGAVTLFLSVLFLTLFGLMDQPRLQAWAAGLMYGDTRERYLRVTDRIVHATSRYMLGNLAISVICGTVYGVTAVILGVPYALALAVISAILDLVPNIGAAIAGIIIALVALTVSTGTMIAFLIVVVVYQQVENYILQPTIVGRAAQVSGFTVLVSILVFGSLFGFIGAIIGVPIAAAIQIVVEELTASRRDRVAAADAAKQQPA